MTKDNFTGQWKFAPEKSVLQISPPTATELMIIHNEPHFHLTRRHLINGINDIFRIDLTINGEATICQHQNYQIMAKLSWQTDHLLFDTVLTTTEMEGKNLVRYRLKDNGKMLIAEENFQSPSNCYENLWVFIKEEN